MLAAEPDRSRDRLADNEPGDGALDGANSSTNFSNARRMKVGSNERLRSLASVGNGFWHSTTSPSSSERTITAWMVSFGCRVWNVTV